MRKELSRRLQEKRTDGELSTCATDATLLHERTSCAAHGALGITHLAVGRL
jgi:hypothetical protein